MATGRGRLSRPRVSMATGRGRLLQQHWLGLVAQHLPRGGGLGAARGSSGQAARPRRGSGDTPQKPWARGQPTIQKANSVSLDSMPAEVMLKIFSYLDAIALLCAGCVSRRFYHLASDNFIWGKIYSAAFSPKRCHWEANSVEKTTVSLSLLSIRNKEAGYWKREYIAKQVASVQAALSQVLKPINPYTGLPGKTKEALRISGLGWVIVLKEKSGKEWVLEHVDLFVNDASVTIVWHGKNWPQLAKLSTLDLCGVTPVFMNRSKPPPKNGPRWHSLINTYDLSHLTDAASLGCDRLIRIFCLNPGLLVGLWKREDELAFVMASLHVHHLVERSILGSATVPYELLPHTPYLDDSLECGLQGYQLHMDMHSGSTFYLCGTFHNLFTRKGQLISEHLPGQEALETVQTFLAVLITRVIRARSIENGYVKLIVISFRNNTEHLPLTGKVGLSWKTNIFDGCIKSCFIMDITLLDEYRRPFWCVSSPVCMKPYPIPLDGPHFLGPTYCVDYEDEEGHVHVELVWMEYTEEYFVVNLVLFLSVTKINRWFGTKY